MRCNFNYVEVDFKKSVQPLHTSLKALHRSMKPLHTFLLTSPGVCKFAPVKTHLHV